MNETPSDHPAINRNVHPPVVALIFIGLAVLLGWLVPIPSPPFFEWIGLGLTIIGVVLGFSAFNEFRKARTTLDPHGSVKALVTAGIYQITRNPIYLGFLLMVIGFPLNSGYYSGLVVAPFFIITMNHLVIEKEEAYLEKRFGEVYTGYRSRVRRWLW